MRKLILFFLALTAVQVSAQQNRWSLGTAIEGRMQEDINPDLPDTRTTPNIFIHYRMWPWVAALEVGTEDDESSSGGLRIRSHTSSFGLWGRREFKAPVHWTPFVSAGAGYHFDSVISTFGPAEDERSGRRGFFGAGGGFSHSLWRHLLVETELRATLTEDRKSIALSGIMRLGLVL